MKTSRILVAGLGCAFLTTAAIGGFVQPFPVDVDLTTNTASGDMVTARYSSHPTEHIGCGIRKTSDGMGGTFSFGFCQAEDRDGDDILCNTTDAALLDVISSSADYGFITFSWNASTDECVRIGFSNQSFYLPKKLDSNE